MNAIDTFLTTHKPQTPCLVMDLAIVRDLYHKMQSTYTCATISYAVKANPETEILRTLHQQGASFDVASVGEIDRVLDLGVSPKKLSYGNTIKKASDIAYAYEKGIRLFAFDSIEELEKIAENAPNSNVFCRLLVDCVGAEWPLSRKFGCEEHYAIELIQKAKNIGVNPIGISIHVGSQQMTLSAWEDALNHVRYTWDTLADKGIELSLLNLGGGMCAQYDKPILSTEEYGTGVMHILNKIFGDINPQIIIEPGRGLVGDAGVIESEVILVSHKTGQRNEPIRWVYLDCGILNGLFETLGEAIRYRFVSDKDGGKTAPSILAGPSCDSADIMYEKNPINLPKDLKSGDKIRILSTGAYTTSYACVWFNGFDPIKTYVVDSNVT